MNTKIIEGGQIVAENKKGKAFKSKRNIFIIGDREIIGSTPKNPVNKRDG